MIQLAGGEKFVITRQLPNPGDATTYYLRAYIRKDLTDEIIATIDLTDKTEQRFRYEWDVPNYADPTFITITTKVFTDAGLTTESARYGRTDEKYLIQRRWSMAFAGGGGSNISYKKIEELVRLIVSEIVEKEIKNIEIPQVKNITKYNTTHEKIIVDLSPFTKLLKDIQDRVDIIRNKKEKDVNFSPVMSEIKQLGDILTKAIKDAPDPQSVDILRAVKEVSNIVESDIKKRIRNEIEIEKYLESATKELEIAKDIFLGKVKLSI